MDGITVGRMQLVIRVRRGSARTIVGGEHDGALLVRIAERLDRLRRG